MLNYYIIILQFALKQSSSIGRTNPKKGQKMKKLKYTLGVVSVGALAASGYVIGVATGVSNNPIVNLYSLQNRRVGTVNKTRKLSGQHAHNFTLRNKVHSPFNRNKLESGSDTKAFNFNTGTSPFFEDSHGNL